MNRKERRAALKRGKGSAVAPSPGGKSDPVGSGELLIAARAHYQQHQFAPAENICQQILAREPAQVHALNLLGVIAQTTGRHDLAIKMFSKAIAVDELNAAYHYNIASSYQVLSRPQDAIVHFRKAIALGMSAKDVEDFIVQNPVTAMCFDRIAAKWPLPITADELFGPNGLQAIANDLFLRCALELTTLRGIALEVFLTQVRAALLRVAIASVLETRPVGDNIVGLSCALAQHCFINEYVFAQSDDEIRQAGELRNLLLENLAGGKEISPLLLAAVAAYLPLNSLPAAETLLNRNWPDALTGLLRQQVHEPLEEARIRGSIAKLTDIEDSVSLQVGRQYDENPYPRWTINPVAVLAGEQKNQTGKTGGEPKPTQDILIAGCGTGRQALQTRAQFPQARILAVDLSVASLAYARRKTQEEGLQNIEYAQADILKLGTINRNFDLIESVGVLHHLADPIAGWRILLSLLRPDGEMLIGLYSETARREIVEGRALIAERGYRATIEDIRKCRQEIMRNANARGWRFLTGTSDFYSMSGCRDLLFNVMEHRFTILQITAFLKEHDLSFLGFELAPPIFEKFEKFSGGADVTDLNAWHAFEIANPKTFQDMYVFAVRRRRPGD